MADRYDDIVAGSGISGLTMALLLARNGRRVLLLEKAGHIGGSVARFSRGGMRFDVGFHFSGGMQNGGILHDILSLLGIRDRIQPVFLPTEHSTSFRFEDSGRTFDHPSGIDLIKARFKDYFPAETTAIERYFDRVRSVCERTPSMNLQLNNVTPPMLDEDYVSLDEVLCGLTSDRTLRGLLSGYVMLYGVQPREISFANHSRMCLSFYESIACLRDGGDAFVQAFTEAFSGLGVEVRTRTHIASLADIRDGIARRFVLSSGEEIEAENCVLTMHPHEIVKLMPPDQVRPAFVDRVQAFEPSAGFFSVFAAVDRAADPYPEQAIVSLFPSSDVNELLDPAYAGEPALVLIKSPQAAPDGRKGVHVLAPMFPESVARWADSRVGRRPKDYYEFKERMVSRIMGHVARELPGYANTLSVVDAASLLTFRDYLHSPDGSAYGIKQKIGQFNLVGKLPLRNLYAAGQSAVLPGVIGAMMSSLIVGRSLMGKDRYGAFVSQELCS